MDKTEGCVSQSFDIKTKILILDDALSKVDSDTESKIVDFIMSEFEDSTIILSSNRLSILSTCSNILVLKSGEIMIQEF